MKSSRSLGILRQQREAFLGALKHSPGMQPYAHLLRDLVDPRPRAEKIRESVIGAIRAIPLTLEIREIVSAVRKRIVRDLFLLPLSEVPCDALIRRYVAEARRNSGTQMQNLGDEVPENGRNAPSKHAIRAAD